jgi:hypothetical protein
MISIHRKANSAILHNIEIISNIPLLNNHRPLYDTIGCHSINQLQSFILVQSCEDEIISECVINEFDYRFGLGVGGYYEGLGHVEGLGEHIFGTFCFLGLGT